VQVDSAYDHTKYIGRDEAQLCGSKSDYAHDDAVDSGQSPAFPTPPSHQDGGRDGEYARKIIKTKHE
jgi:hypothetical protein